MKKVLLALLMLIVITSSVLGQQTLGTFESGNDVTLIQSCDASSYSNITKITYPNSTLAVDSELAMVANGNTYSYIFSDTDDLGDYLVYGHCDEKGTDTVWVYDFEITSTGQKVSLSNSIIVFALLGLAAIFLVISFFFKEDYWILKSFFQFLSVGAGLIAVNSARIISSESNSLGAMGNVGIIIMIVVMLLFFLWIFVYAFIEVIKTFKEKRSLRWDYS